ncbi:MAG: class D sortase [Bacillota bacterium]
MRNRPKKNRSRGAQGRALPWLLIAAGGLLLAVAFGMKWSARLEQEKLLARYAAQHTTGFETPSLPDAIVNPDDDAALSPPEADAPAQSAAPEGTADAITPIAVLSIPKIDLTVAVGEGVDDHTLKYTVGHFPNTALAGEKGNFCLIGHRNYTFGEFFNRLDELEAGDRVTVDRDGAIYTYVITESFVVEPTDTWVLNPTEDAEITLITCTPIRIATHRLIVKGVLEQ